jgi:hypothetical protein
MVQTIFKCYRVRPQISLQISELKGNKSLSIRVSNRFTTGVSLAPEMLRILDYIGIADNE